jgi:predicted nucleic acid-binding protein
VGLIDDVGPGPVAFDTAPFIYFIQDQAPYSGLVEPLLERAATGKLSIVTSALTLLEVLVVPYRNGHVQLAERYESLLTRSRGVSLVDPTHDHLRAAAQLRAATGARTPDAIHLATALIAGCRAFVTNDRRLPSLPGLRILQLSDY